MAGIEAQTVSILVKTPCWVWTGATCNKGYGTIRVDGQTRRCHILAWEYAVGRKVRAGYTLDHECRVTKCCRPSHLEEVTRSVNTARGNRANPRSTEHLRRPRDKSIPVADNQQPVVREEGDCLREPGLREEGDAGTAPKQT